MAITINGTDFPDGSTLLIDSVQAQFVTVDGTEVWRYATGGDPGPPEDVTDFTASDGQVGKITMNWTPVASNPPVDTNILYEDGTPLSDISPGYELAKPGGGTHTYFIKMTNTEGTTDSNTDVGTADPLTSPPEQITNFTASDDREGEILVNWTPVTSDPPVTSHDLYINSSLAASNVYPGYMHTISPGSYSMFVRAKSDTGWTDSNTDTGTSLEELGDIPPHITDFVASDNLEEMVQFTFSPVTGGSTITGEKVN
jgi:hypothetical protein